MKHFLILFLLLTSYYSLFAQEIDSVYSAGGSQQDFSRAFHRDVDGNFYVILQTGRANINFFGSMLSKPAGFGTVYQVLGKMDSTMNVEWVKYLDYNTSVTTTLTSYPIAVDRKGNVYLTDYAIDSTYKFDSNGNQIWQMPFFADQIQFDENDNPELFRYQSYNDSVNGEPITNSRGTVTKIDSSGNYLSHFIMDDVNYDQEFIEGKNKRGYYGYRQKLITPQTAKYELFLCDSAGAIQHVKFLCFISNPGFSQMKITSDDSNNQYYVHGFFPNRQPINALDSSIRLGESLHIVQLDSNFNFKRTLKLGPYNLGNPSTFFLTLKPYKNDIYLGGHLYFTNRFTHLGNLNYLNGQEDQLIYAKLDQTLNTKWFRVLNSTYYANTIDFVAPTSDGIYFGGHTDRINAVTPSYTANGPHDVVIFKVQDNDSTSAYIQGHVFYDANQNGINDMEPGIENQQISNFNVNGISYTDYDGNFEVAVDTGLNTIKSLSIPSYWARSTSDSINVNVLPGDTILKGFKFGIYPVPNIKEVEVDLTNLTPARIAFQVAYVLTYQNNATDTLSGTIKLIQDSSLIFQSSSVLPNSTIGDTLIWHYSSLIPGEQRQITIYDSLTNNIALLDSFLFNTVSITPEFGDTIVENNRDTLYHFITGSYDPNLKEVSPECIDTNFVKRGDFLYYTIRFQNTGTDTAINVVLKDTMSNLLDKNTLEVLNASHRYKLSLEHNTFIWFFENIMLPDSNASYIASNGYVKFRIKLKPSTTANDLIENSADIYFDFNDPIRTNTVFTSFPSLPDTSYITQCNFYTSIGAMHIWNKSGLYYDTLSNFRGCDSVILVNLTILNSSFDTLTLEACGDFTSPSGKYIWKSSGVYSDTLLNSNGCDSIVAINLTLKKADTAITVNGTTLMSSASGASFQWLDCSNDYIPIAGENSQSFTAPVNGDYAVEVTQNGCTDTSICKTISTVGLFENSWLQEVSIFPNPTDSRVNIDFGSLKNVSLNVFTVEGELILNYKNINTSKYQFELNEPSGVYLIELINSRGEKYKYRLIKK